MQIANSKAQNGFTMIELVVVLAIIFMLAIIAVASFGRFRSNTLLRATDSEIKSALSEARNLTLSSKDADMYGVHFESDRIVRFKGGAYSAGAQENRTTVIDPRVEIAGINIVSGNNVIFKRLTGATPNTGTIVVAIKSDNSRVATTTILSTGIIE